MSGGRVAFALTFGLTIGCGVTSRRDPIVVDVAGKPCVAVDSAPRSNLAASPLAGAYRLTMVATSGPRTGRSATGTLALDAHVGHASMALDSVGATAAGDIGSRDPNRPGVMLVSPPNDPSASPMLRFGADANRTDLRPFDGAYLVLTVDFASAPGFAGRWRSGVGTVLSGGYFCADLSS